MIFWSVQFELKSNLWKGCRPPASLYSILPLLRMMQLSGQHTSGTVRYRQHGNTINALKLSLQTSVSGPEWGLVCLPQSQGYRKLFTPFLLPCSLSIVVHVSKIGTVKYQPSTPCLKHGSLFLLLHAIRNNMEGSNAQQIRWNFCDIDSRSTFLAIILLIPIFRIWV